MSKRRIFDLFHIFTKTIDNTDIRYRHLVVCCSFPLLAYNRPDWRTVAGVIFAMIIYAALNLAKGRNLAKSGNLTKSGK